ncbi:MAG: sulfatase [Planctomycetes bacterium]|nr:sulfatase [Planctomycetota bacterium]
MLAASLLPACGDSKSNEPEATDLEVPERASILFVLIDTLRADHTSLVGHVLGRSTTPFLEELAEHSIVFDRAYSAASWTRPSVASIFTSRLPSGHGCEQRQDVLSPDVTTLAEALQADGFTTSGVLTNGNVLGKWGFDQGFDIFEHVKDFPRHAYADAKKLRQPVIAAVDALRLDDPWFLYLHYVDPHDPYMQHDETDFDPHTTSTVDGSMASLEPYRWARPSDVDAERFIELYDGDILWIDGELRRLFARLDERGVLEHAWVVITSDHGEGLWDHRIQAHGQEVFEHQIHVPLLVRPPGGLAEGRRIEQPISLIDVAPTLLELVHAPVPGDFEGRSWAGALLHGAAPPARPVVVVEHVDNTDMLAIIDGTDKLIVDGDPKTGGKRLYDLVSNPRERPEQALDVLKERSSRAAGLERQLMEIVRESAAGRPAKVTGEASDDERAQLEALGYVQGKDGDGANAPHPSGAVGASGDEGDGDGLR